MYRFKETYTLDFSKVTHIQEVHKIIKEELDFPDYYGENWYAFWDCLTDMATQPLHIRLIGLEQMQKNFPWDTDVMLKTLKDLKHWANDKYVNQIQIDFVLGDGVVSFQ